MSGWNKPKNIPGLSPVDLRRIVGLNLTLLVLIAAIYMPVWHASFVNYADPDRVLGNAAVGRGLTRAGAAWAFTTGANGIWFPITWLSHMLDVRLFGPSAGGHHLTSVLLHLASALLLFASLRRATTSIGKSAFVALLFAVHPLQVEPVAWIAQRQIVLGAFFAMVTVYAHVRYAQAGRARWYWLVVGGYGMALMADPSLIMLPVCLLLLDVWPLGRSRQGTQADPATGSNATRRAAVPDLIWEKLPLFALAVAVSVVVFAVRRSAPLPLEPLSIPARLANLAMSLVAYAGHWLWPRNLAVFYGYDASQLSLKVVASLVLVSGISAAAYWQRRVWPYLAVGWLWYLCLMIPPLLLVRRVDDVMGDRYMYLPLIGLSIALVWMVSVADASLQLAPRVTLVAGTLVIFACAAQSRHLVGYWQASVPLWERARSVNVPNHLIEGNLGQSYAAENEPELAATHFRESVRLAPTDPRAVAALATQLVREGKTDEAIEQYLRVLQAVPDPTAHYRVAQLLRSQGRVADADEHLRAALQLRPDFLAARLALESSSKSEQPSEPTSSPAR